MAHPMTNITFTGDHNQGSQVGVNTGTFQPTHNHYYSADLHETTPDPTILIPFPPDADFVQRGTLLDQIQEACSVPGSRTALVGLGGVGKSQLAIQYAYQTREGSPAKWVFWVYASNAARLEQGFRSIANLVKIRGRRDPGSNILELVHDWLHDERNGQWLLILDNVDDAQHLSDHASGRDGQPLESYLPQCQHGCVLVTSRNKQAAETMVEERNIIEVGPMTEEAAVALLKRKMPDTADKTAELALLLEYMPLAIVQAVAYITARSRRYSVAQYIEDFHNSERKQSSLLNYEGGKLRRDREAKNSVIVTWEISFEHIRQIRQSAADLLSLMSFYDPQGIPETLLRTYAYSVDKYDMDKRSKSNTSETADEDDGFEEDVQILRNFSLISLAAKEAIFDFQMHRLVQLATRKWLEARKKLEHWLHRSIEALDSGFPTGAYENWAMCARYLPHVQLTSARQPKDREALLRWSSLLYHAAWYTWLQGDASMTLNLSIMAWKAKESVLGEEDARTLSSMGMVASAYNMAGRWKEAEQLQVQVIETSKTVLGQDHPSTLASINNLASTYSSQGRWKEAEQLKVQVLETSKRVLGQDHPHTLTSMANLASTYWNQGRWDEAEQLFVQVIETHKTVLGQDHPSTLSSMGNLALTYSDQGRWKEAEQLEVQVLETRKRVLGQDHPHTLTSMANLALTLRALSKRAKAHQLLKECVTRRRHALGEDHHLTIESETALSAWSEEDR